MKEAGRTVLTREAARGIPKVRFISRLDTTDCTAIINLSTADQTCYPNRISVHHRVPMIADIALGVITIVPSGGGGGVGAIAMDRGNILRSGSTGCG
uniref:p0047B08.4 protein n=1 Tax=Oryza sativa subsp. japonica TaxID=39947 RepID=Q94JA7_ORYSJ|nr:P0047B08.4 [Oryza sativa Japonica Group]